MKHYAGKFAFSTCVFISFYSSMQVTETAKQVLPSENGQAEEEPQKTPEESTKEVTKPEVLFMLKLAQFF